MKRLITILSCLLLCQMIVAQKNPKWFNKARHMQLTIYAYDAKGTMHDAQAFYTDESGIIVTEYDPLKGAVRANVIDASSNESEVTRVHGISSLYNVVRLNTQPTKKISTPLPAVTDILTEGEPVVIMPHCSNDKMAQCLYDTIAAVQQFDEEGYPYYTLRHTYDQRLSGTLVLTIDGRVVGSLQHAAQRTDQPAYVIGISYAQSLKIRAIDAKNADLKAINLQPAIPGTASEANAFLYLLDHDSETYHQAVLDYIQTYPQQPNGYVELAEWYFAHNDYTQAENTYINGASLELERKDELHYSFAKKLYQYGLQNKKELDNWTFDRALSEIDKAICINPLPIYTAFEGTCLYAMARYEEAYAKFIEVTNTNLRSSEMFLYAAQCKQMMNAATEEVLALQDTALSFYAAPYPKEAANIIYLRAKSLEKLGRWREAVVQMNEYEHIMAGRVSAQFYYEREQMEMQCRMYPAAISDIDRACKMVPDEPLYKLEMAVIHYRVGELAEAIDACKDAIRLNDTFTDAHRILGICLRDKGQIAEAKASLQRAVELGDEMAAEILEKMK